ncbi:MAG: nwsA, partial [Verrucomicrobia bacterium]|nr:nwsA [Verrucomicrobiota bacterium]
GAEAMESTPQENRVIEIRGRTGRFEDGPALILRIRDHGTGVKAPDEGRLFAPFHSTKSQGLGLGLTISRSIIEAHCGSLALVTSEGAGATFEILLPLEEKPCR